MEPYNKSHSEYSGAVCEESAAFLFDTRAPFEQWLQLLDAIRVTPKINFSSETEPRDADAMHPGSLARTECDVTFEGVLCVDGRLSLKGNIRSSDGTLIMVFEGHSVLLERMGDNDLSEICEVESKADLPETDPVVT